MGHKDGNWLLLQLGCMVAYMVGVIIAVGGVKRLSRERRVRARGVWVSAIQTGMLRFLPAEIPSRRQLSLAEHSVTRRPAPAAQDAAQIA
jgi:hypothetical protein